MKKLPLVIAMASSLALLGGCATQESSSGDTAALQKQVDAARSEASRLRTELSRAQMSSGDSTQNVAMSGGDMLPPNAQPGHCYARVLTPAVYQTGEETVLSRAASERIEIIPEEYGVEEQTVLVKEQSTRLEVLPATYRTVTEEVMVEPEKTIMREIPAEYGTETEQILVKPAYTTWKKGRGPIEKINDSTGEIMCLVEVPAEYKTVTRRVVASPARTVEEVIPAKYKTVSRTVVDTPATTREVVIPEQYDTVTVRKVVSPPSTRSIEIPAEYKTVSTRKLVSDSKLDWREILCETNTTPGLIARLQRALNSAGYDAGDNDGVLGSQTMSAVQKYQADNKMARGQLTLAVFEKLGVSL